MTSSTSPSDGADPKLVSNELTPRELILAFHLAGFICIEPIEIVARRLS